MNGHADSTADRGHGTRTEKLTTKYPSVESVGFFLFLSLLFVIPLVEALKNILIVGLFVWWLAAGNIARDLRTAPLYVKCFLLFSMLPLVTLFTSDLTDADELIFDVKGTVKFGIVLLPVYSLSMMKNGQEKSVTLPDCHADCRRNHSVHRFVHFVETDGKFLYGITRRWPCKSIRVVFDSRCDLCNYADLVKKDRPGNLRMVLVDCFSDFPDSGT